MQIRTIAAPLQLPTASLFTTRPESSARYLVETDPRFTQYKAWIGSDYLMQALRVDPAAFGKRMGDAFYEQTLVREQVLALTGQRFVGDYRDDDSQFRALMDAGLSYARQWDLRPGIALSPEQVAQLTSDMVWLVTREVTLPDGSRQSVLVPQVYVRVRPGDIDGTGALIAGRDVSITLSGDARNSGTIAGRNLVRINAAGIDNQNGAMAADILDLKAALDIDNTGGRLQAHRAMRLDAGRDLKVVTTTAESASAAGGNAFTRTGVDRMAGLYITGPAGELLAKAGRDIDLTAAQVQNDGTGVTSFQAGRNVNLGTATTGESQDIQWDGSNYVRQSGSREVVTRIRGGGTVVLNAQGDINNRAADVQAQGAAALIAGGNVINSAAQSTQTLDAGSQHTSHGWISSRTVTIREQTLDQKATTSTISGEQVIVLGQNVISEGTQFKGKSLIQVEGADKTLLYAAQDVHQSDVTRQDKSRTLGLTTSKSQSNDSTFQAQALGTRLESDQALRIGVGTVTDLQGAVLAAPKIEFTRSQGTDTSQPGQLILGSSTDVKQDARTEKTVTAGVWQVQKGQGSTSQTANPTQILGQLSIDPSVRVSAPLGLLPGQAVADQAKALSQQPGLAYLKDLQANPQVDWKGIELAKEQWNYRQEGLTPAGAAILAIALTAATGGMGVELLGTASTAATGVTTTTLAGTTLATTTAAGAVTYTAAGAALNAGFSALAAQAGVSLVNNQGDIGKTLKDLGRSESIKNIALAMVSAGALTELGNTLVLDGKPLAAIKAVDGFGANLGKNLANNMAQAAITSAVTGTPLEDAIKTGLVSAVVSAGGAHAANAIGEFTVPDPVTGQAVLNPAGQALAHALAGCVAGAAGAGSQGCRSGATGAVVGELAAQWVNPTGDPAKTEQTLNVVRVASALAGALTGDGSAQSVSTAVMTGVNAAQNNYLKHAELQARNQQLAACKDDTCRKQVTTYWDKVSQERNAATGDAITGTLASGGAGASTAANLQTMQQLSADMQGLAQYRAELEGQMQGARDPAQRATLQQQIAATESSMRQVASQGKDALSVLSQQTGDPKYQAAFQALTAATSGSELGGALAMPGGGGGNAGRAAKGARSPAQQAEAARIGALADEARAANSALARTGTSTGDQPYVAPRHTSDQDVQTHGLPSEQVPGNIVNRLTKELEPAFGDRAPDKADELIASGRTVPTPVQVTPKTKLYKLVAEGNPLPPSAVSPYFIDAAQLLRIKNNPSLANDILGLPFGSQGARFRVYEIQPKTGEYPTVYQSNVATITNREGPTSVGNAAQTLVPDRSLWTEPRLTNISIGGRK